MKTFKNLLSIKYQYNLARNFASMAVLFWVVETTYFLIACGWHFRAANTAEKMCDDVVTIMMALAGALWLICAVRVVDKILDSIKDERL